MSRLTAALLLLAVLAPSVSTGPATSPAVSAKRGVSCGGGAAGPLAAGWYYSWYIDQAPGAVAAEFVPMIAHGRDANSWYWDRLAKLKGQGRVTTLLGFNEPERPAPGGQVSVDDAIAAWPAFERTGLRLGSPAPAYDRPGRAWLTDFMAKADARHLRVDFVAVHWYGDVAAPDAAGQFLAWLAGVHRQYNRPVWVTEFAGLNWGWLHHPVTAEQNERFAAVVLPQLERTPWVERYCWFDEKPANLFEDVARTRLTGLGRVYRGGR